MAPNKFEKHIKEELNKREIKPSDEAWEKLSSQLNTSNQSQKKGYVWYGVAASFIGLLVVSVLYLNRNETQITPNIQVVDLPEEEIKDNTNFDTDVLLEDTIKEVEITASTIKNNVKKESISSDKLASKISSIEDMNALPEKENLAIKDVQVDNKLASKIINSKIVEVITQVDLLEKNNDALTDAEVDSLLRNAQREIMANKLFRKDNNSVDAMALLATVEGELDTSFRNQIFETLKTGFLKARTALADRNN